MVTEYLVSPIAKQVEENSLVVWYDPGAHYLAVAERLEIPAGLLPNSCGSWGHGVKLCMGSWRQALFFVFISGCAPRIRKMPSIKCEVPNLMDDFSRAPTESRIIEESRLTVGVRKTARHVYWHHGIFRLHQLPHLSRRSVARATPQSTRHCRWRRRICGRSPCCLTDRRIIKRENCPVRGASRSRVRTAVEGTIQTALSEISTVEVRQTHRTYTFAFRRGIRESSHASTTKSDSSCTTLRFAPTPPYSK